MYKMLRFLWPALILWAWAELLQQQQGLQLSVKLRNRTGPQKNNAAATVVDHDLSSNLWVLNRG